MKTTGILFSVLVIVIAIAGCTQKKHIPVTYFHTQGQPDDFCENAQVAFHSVLSEPIGEWTVHVEMIKGSRYLTVPWVPDSGGIYGMAIDFVSQSDEENDWFKFPYDFSWEHTSMVFARHLTWDKDTSDCFEVESVVIECMQEGTKITATPTWRFYSYRGDIFSTNYGVFPIDTGLASCGWGQDYVRASAGLGHIVLTERPSIQFGHFELPKDTDSVRVSFDVTMLDKSEDEEITKHYSTVLYKYEAKLK